jgi:transposase
MREHIARFWDALKQKTLFPMAEEQGPLTEPLERLLRMWEVLRIEEHVQHRRAWTGRAPKSRKAMARAFVAKAVLNIPDTAALVERLHVDAMLRRLCGFEQRRDVASEATFSRAFQEFADTELGQRAHEALVKEVYGEAIVGHASRDATAIEGREKPASKPPTEPEARPRKRGRPKRGEPRPAAEPTRLQRQSEPGVCLEAMVSELPRVADIGCKKNARGFIEKWAGYKLHLDVADTGIPLSAILTSASTHDSQVAIPLMYMTGERAAAVLYELMDAAYDAPLIYQASQNLGRVPLIDLNPRRDPAKQQHKAQRLLLKQLGVPLAEDVRYNERTTVERANARLKDEFGARNVRVKGGAKVMCHLMFGVCVLAADAVLRLLT